MDIIKPINFKKTNGIYENDKLAFLSSLIESKKHDFDYFNIILRQQDDKDSNINIISPTEFYKSFSDSKTEPKVPQDANENQILSFYGSLFSKYNNLTYDTKTFLYQKEFPQFETEVILLSSLIKKTNSYKDFDKPYASVEFFINNQSEDTIKNYYMGAIQDNQEKLKYLKRFVVNSEKLDNQNKTTNFVKNYKSNITTNIYRSFVEPLGANTPDDKTEIFENNIPNGVSDGFIGEDQQKLLPAAVINPNTISDLLTYKKTCNYDIVGYVITKSKDDKIIKRTYILNDKTHIGYIKYFDSQIIENANYSYKIEQINNIYGVTYSINNNVNQYPPIFKNGVTPKQKDAFIQKLNEPSIDDVLGQTGGFSYSSKEDEITLPFFKNSALSVDVFFDSRLKQMVAYSPITNQKTLSPDIELSTEIITTPPSTPDIKIYSKKGESRNVLIVLSNLISKEAEVTGIENKVNVIDLGASIKQQQFATKELRVFRTEDRPTSYESFSKEPRKILDPNFPDFVDPIEPNTIYYYYADAVDSKETKSLPSKVLKLQMVEEQSHVFPLLEVYDFGEDKEIITEKIFKKNIRISPTFLQSTVGPKGVVGEYINQEFKEGYTNKLFDTSKNILDTTLNPSHKIRVTSKKTRRRFDINTIFSYEYVKDFKTVPEDAILVLEEEKKISTEEVKGVSKDIFGNTGKCDIGETLDEFLAGLSGVGGASFIVAIIVGGLFTKAAQKVSTKQQCDNIAPLIIETLSTDPDFNDVPQDSKNAVIKSLQGKVIKGNFTS